MSDLQPDNNVQYSAVELREMEVAAYQRNIDTYTAILTTLPTDIPAHLEPYRNRTDKHEAIKQVEDFDDVTLLSDYWYGQEIKGLIRTEMLEQRKAKAILAYLKEQENA